MVYYLKVSQSKVSLVSVSSVSLQDNPKTKRGHMTGIMAGAGTNSRSSGFIL